MRVSVQQPKAKYLHQQLPAVLSAGRVEGLPHANWGMPLLVITSQRQLLLSTHIWEYRGMDNLHFFIFFLPCCFLTGKNLSPAHDLLLEIMSFYPSRIISLHFFGLSLSFIVFWQLLWVCMQSESIFRGTLRKRLSQDIKHLQARFLDTTINKSIFFLFLGGKHDLRRQYKQSSKFKKTNRQLYNTAGWRLLCSEGGVSTVFTCCWEEGSCLKLLMKHSFASQCADAGNTLQLYSWYWSCGRM